ncbi:MAG: amidase [Chroococcidiopsidaceae cyanobacterium CP_BM_RX_35]|nr:amidase [Chroococcidiopsidaceae cyanobacterium CP_BM_RX_35]
MRYDFVIGQFKQAALLAAPCLILGMLPANAKTAVFSLQSATISDIHAAYSAGALTCTKLTQLYLNRIAAYNNAGPRLNAVVYLNPYALKDAAAEDEQQSHGIMPGPLYGVPVLIKDSYNVKGLPTTNGLGAFKSLIATEDSFVVRQLRAAGAIILGKANMSTWAFSYDGISESYGPVLNPYAPNRTTGGSSSGSGVGTTASLAAFAMGGETGGSIRVPSTQNSLVGLKPSAGLISVDGTWSLTPERDVIGPITKSVADIAISMDVLAASDPKNIWNPFLPGVLRPASYTSYLNSKSLRGKVIGLPRPYIGKGDPANGPSYPLDSQIAAAFEQAKQVLVAEGAKVVEVDIPAYKTWFVNRSSLGYNFFDTGDAESRAYGYEQLIEGYNNDQIKSFVDLLNIIPQDNPNYSYVKSNAALISSGQAQPFDQLPQVSQSLHVIAKLRTEQYENFMKANGIDAFAFPTLNYLAPPLASQGDAVYAVYGSLPARFEANILGVPAITVPMGYSKEGIPMSLEFMGKYLDEADIISYAYDYEQATKLRRPPALVNPLPGELFEYSVP